MVILAAIFVWTLVACLVTVGMYRWDKQAAIQGQKRVPERTLLVISLLGGWPGGWLASRWWRHKTQKISYRIKFWICALCHSMALGWAIWSLFAA